MSDLQKVTLKELAELPASDIEMALRTIDYRNAGVLDAFTNGLADHLESEADKTLYRSAVTAALLGLIEDVKLPVWLSWMRGRIASAVIAWSFDHASDFLVDLLRKIR